MATKPSNFSQQPSHKIPFGGMTFRGVGRHIKKWYMGVAFTSGWEVFLWFLVHVWLFGYGGVQHVQGRQTIFSSQKSCTEKKTDEHYILFHGQQMNHCFLLRWWTHRSQVELGWGRMSPATKNLPSHVLSFVSLDDYPSICQTRNKELQRAFGRWDLVWHMVGQDGRGEYQVRPNSTAQSIWGNRERKKSRPLSDQSRSAFPAQVAHAFQQAVLKTQPQYKRHLFNLPMFNVCLFVRSFITWLHVNSRFKLLCTGSHRWNSWGK